LTFLGLADEHLMGDPSPIGAPKSCGRLAEIVRGVDWLIDEVPASAAV
jgi:hypothetical protein